MMNTQAIQAKVVSMGSKSTAPEGSTFETLTTSACDAILREANRVLDASGLLENGYLESLASGAMSLEGFRESQEQFFFAVVHFPRPMAQIVSRIPDPRDRLDLLHNLLEEHGEFDPDKFHEATFRKFLALIGARTDPAEECQCGPAALAFNAALDGVCAVGDLDAAVACMGLIEYAFADISTAIAAGCVRRGWVPEAKLVHYSLHAEIDRRHAEEFFAVVAPRWSDPERRRCIESGLRLGAHVFDRLYRDLLEAPCL